MRSLVRRLLARRAAADPAGVFLADARSSRVVTYAALEAAAGAWAAELDGRGVGAGARVLLDARDPVAFTVAYLGVVAAGRACAPVDPAAPPHEAERARRALRPALVLRDRPADPDGPEPTVRIDPGSGRPAGRALCAGPGPSPGAGSVVLTTSGSSGTPKPVALTEGQLLHVARAVARHHRLGPGDRGFCPLPLFHVNAQVVGVLASLVAGAELVLDRRFARTGFWDLVAEREITWINAAPAILAILARDPGPVRVDPRLRFARSASAALPGPVRALFQARTGLPVVESYGMTEAASQITATPLDAPHRPGSVGLPVAVEVRVTDAAGAPVPAGALGRVGIRGPGVITAYAGAPAGSAVDADGWLDTADLGRLDDDGYLYLAGRADDVINRGGELVHPREVEEVLLGEPDVAEAVVVGRPDDVLGAVAVACVRPAADIGPDAAAELPGRLVDRCARELAPWKRPAEIQLVEAFPRGPTGKVRRRVLRDRLTGVG